jgi:hypothetical protein
MSTTTGTRRNTTATRKRPEVSLSKLRSGISNGSMLFPDVDHRSAWMRRLRDLISDHVSDLGGPDRVSSSEAILIRRASMLTLQLEMMESRWATEREGPKSLELYQRTTGALRRTLETLGLRRRPRDITPNPLDYARQYDRLQAEDAEEVA